MHKSRKYKPVTDSDYRPNTRKMYEEYHGVTVLPWCAVHHILPVRFGGKHEVSNLVVLTIEEHAQAHLELYERFGDPRDLCAHYMISGHTEKSRLIACSMGGKASQTAKKNRGDPNGFQLFDVAKRKAIASKAGSVGGSIQKELGVGIHVDEETRREWARAGGYASIEILGFKDPVRQSERGKKGGVKNKGAKWYNDGVSNFCYTSTQRLSESFEDFLSRTGMTVGKVKGVWTGSKFYNNGEKQFMFLPSNHAESFEEFLANNGFVKGRLKNENQKHQTSCA